MALYKVVITNVVDDCMCWCLDEIFFLSIIILHHNWCLDIVLEGRICLSTNKFVSNENTRSDAAENSFDFPALFTSRQSSGNSFTRCEAVMLFGSLDSSQARLWLWTINNISRETTHRQYARWLKSLQVRAMHKLHSLGEPVRIHLCSWSGKCFMSMRSI